MASFVVGHIISFIALRMVRNNMKFKEFEEDIIRNYVKGNILDLGCGFGRLYSTLSELGSYTGIDISKEGMEEARTNYPQGNFIEMDAGNLGFEDNSFDIVFAGFNVIDEVEDLPNTFIEVKRILKPNGLFIFSMHNKYYLKQIIREYTVKRNDKTIIPRSQSIREMINLCSVHLDIEKVYGNIFTPYPYFICRKVDRE